METSAAALEAALTTNPDVVLMDYRLPDGDGVDAARRIKAALPDTRVVMLTASSDDGRSLTCRPWTDVVITWRSRTVAP